MQKVGVTLEAAQSSEFIRQMTASKQSVIDFTSVVSGAAGNLRTYNSAAEGAAQANAALKSRQIEVAQANVQLKQSQTEATQALTSYRTAQTEGVQSATRYKTAQTEATQELTKLRTAQTEAVQTSNQLKTAQVGEVQAATELKQAQAGAVSELAKLRTAQAENVSVATQVKQAEIGEAQAATQLKTAQAGAATELAKLRTEQTQAVKSTTEIKVANLALDNQMKQTRLSMLQQKQAQTETGQSASGFGSILAGIGPKGAIAAAAAVGISKSVITMAGDFDASMAKVQVATGVSDRQSEAFKRLEEAARTVGGSTKFSATEAAEGLATLAQAGLDANQSIEALPAVAKAAEVNQVSMGEAAKTVTVAMNAFSLSASDATKIIDIQTAAAASGVLDFSDFQGAIAAVGSVGKSAGQDLEGTTATIIAMTNAGQSATDAGTSLKSALQHLQNPSKDARASMDELGLSVYDTSGNMRPFSDIIAQIEQKTKDLLPVQKDQILANIFQSDGIKAVTSSMGAHVDVMRDGKKVTLEGSEALKEWERQLKNSAGSTDKAASILNSTFNAKLEKMIGNIQDAAIGIGEKLLPQVSGLVETFSSIVDKVSGIEDATHILTTMASISFTPLTEGLKLVNRELGNLSGEGKNAAQSITDLGKSTNSFQAPNLNQASSDMWSFRQAAEKAKDPVKDLGQAFTKTFDQAEHTQALQTYTEHLDFIGKRAADAQHGLDNLKTAMPPLSTTISNLTNTGGILSRQFSDLTTEVDRLRQATDKSSQAMSQASGQVNTINGAVSGMNPKIQAAWQEWQTYTEKASDGGSATAMWSDKADEAKQKLIQLDPKMASYAQAWQLANNKLQDATQSYQDNTVSMVLNEGAQDATKQKLDDNTKSLVELKRNLGRAGESFYDTASAANSAGKSFQGTTTDTNSTTKAIQDYNATPVVSKTALTNFGQTAKDVANLITKIIDYNNTPVAPKNTGNKNYASGTKDHPGGPATVAEGNRAEIVKMPGSAPMLIDKASFFPALPRHTIVYNPAETARMVNYPMSAQQMMQSTVNNYYNNQPNYNLGVNSMQSSGDIMSDFAFMQLLGA